MKKKLLNLLSSISFHLVSKIGRSSCYVQAEAWRCWTSGFCSFNVLMFCGNVNSGSGSIILEDGRKQQPKDEHHKCHGHPQRPTDEGYKEEASQRK